MNIPFHVRLASILGPFSLAAVLYWYIPAELTKRLLLLTSVISMSLIADGTRLLDLLLRKSNEVQDLDRFFDSDNVLMVHSPFSLYKQGRTIIIKPLLRSFFTFLYVILLTIFGIYYIFSAIISDAIILYLRLIIILPLVFIFFAGIVILLENKQIEFSDHQIHIKYRRLDRFTFKLISIKLPIQALFNSEIVFHKNILNTKIHALKVPLTEVKDSSIDIYQDNIIIFATEQNEFLNSLRAHLLSFYHG